MEETFLSSQAAGHGVSHTWANFMSTCSHCNMSYLDLVELLAVEGAVRDVTGAEGEFYDVVTKAGRAAPAYSAPLTIAG